MAIEHARMRAVRKPWGSTDLLPWSEIKADSAAVGELWFQRPDADAPKSTLLLKLLFTKEPLSIQVHPDDAFAHAIGLANGKTEAWYILSATPEAQVAVGLKRQHTAAQLRTSIEDGSIAESLNGARCARTMSSSSRRAPSTPSARDSVLAEIQQSSDTTYRLFEQAAARNPRGQRRGGGKSGTGRMPVGCAAPERFPLGARRQPAFRAGAIDLPENSSWQLNAEREAWVLVLEGHAQIGLVNAFVGEAIFVEADQASLKVGSHGLKALLAYPGPTPIRGLLQDNRTKASFPDGELLRSGNHWRATPGPSIH